MNNSVALGIDIGGSHITAALVDLETSCILPNTYLRKSINSHDTAEHIINSWSDVMEKVFDFEPGLPKRIGIAMPGPFDYEKGICLLKDQDKYDALYGLNVKELLASQLKIEPACIRLMNDAGCFLQGEAMGGAARGFHHAIGLTLGTGLGCATYHEGISRDADLWNHPFKESIAEDYISSRWFINYYQSVSGIRVESVKQLAQLAAVDPGAQEVFKLFGRNLGLFLSEFISKEKPKVIVLGGNISQAIALFIAETEKVLTGHAVPFVLKQACLGEEAALIGAAGSWNMVQKTLKADI